MVKVAMVDAMVDAMVEVAMVGVTMIEVAMVDDAMVEVAMVKEPAPTVRNVTTVGLKRETPLLPAARRLWRRHSPVLYIVLGEKNWL